MSKAETAAPKASTDPTERSISPATRTMVKPIAIRAMFAEWLKMLETFRAVKK
jgi:hypothetical protein